MALEGRRPRGSGQPGGSISQTTSNARWLTRRPYDTPLLHDDADFDRLADVSALEMVKQS